MTDLLIVPRDAALPYYLSWFTERQLPAPALGSLGIFVASKELGPIAGVGVFVTDGPYFFLENLATAPSLPAKLRHRAVLALAEQARILGAIMNKHPLLSANSTGLVRTLVRGGFNISRSVPMWGTPVVQIRGLKREENAAKEVPARARSVSPERKPMAKGSAHPVQQEKAKRQRSARSARGHEADSLPVDSTEGASPPSAPVHGGRGELR